MGKHHCGCVRLHPCVLVSVIKVQAPPIFEQSGKGVWRRRLRFRWHGLVSENKRRHIESSFEPGYRTQKFNVLHIACELLHASERKEMRARICTPIYCHTRVLLRRTATRAPGRFSSLARAAADCAVLVFTLLIPASPPSEQLTGLFSSPPAVYQPKHLLLAFVFLLCWQNY